MNKHTIFVDSKKGGMYSIRAELIKKNYCDDKPKNKHTVFVDSKKEGMYSIRAVLLKKTTTTFTVMINPIHP